MSAFSPACNCDGKRLIGAVTLTTALAALVLALLATPIYTARTALIPPGSQQQSGSAAALAALGSLGGFVGGLGMKTSDELYVTLLKSESVTRALDERFDLKAHYQVKENETLRNAITRRSTTGDRRRHGGAARASG